MLLVKGCSRVAFILAFAWCLHSSHAKLPNFLVLLVDDTGAADLNISGIPHDTPAITPNILAMSQSSGSVVIPRFYIGGSVCSPTRASVLTGKREF